MKKLITILFLECFLVNSLHLDWAWAGERFPSAVGKLSSPCPGPSLLRPKAAIEDKILQEAISSSSTKDGGYRLTDPLKKSLNFFSSYAFLGRGLPTEMEGEEIEIFQGDLTVAEGNRLIAHGQGYAEGESPYFLFAELLNREGEPYQRTRELAINLARHNNIRFARGMRELARRENDARVLIHASLVDPKYAPPPEIFWEFWQVLFRSAAVRHDPELVGSHVGFTAQIFGFLGEVGRLVLVGKEKRKKLKEYLFSLKQSPDFSFIDVEFLERYMETVDEVEDRFRKNYVDLLRGTRPIYTDFVLSLALPSLIRLLNPKGWPDEAFVDFVFPQDFRVALSTELKRLRRSEEFQRLARTIAGEGDDEVPMTAVIGDIKGDARALNIILKRILERGLNRRTNKIIMLGDIFGKSRGRLPEGGSPLDVYDILWKFEKKFRGREVYLYGPDELFFLFVMMGYPGIVETWYHSYGGKELLEARNKQIRHHNEEQLQRKGEGAELLPELDLNNFWNDWKLKEMVEWIKYRFYIYHLDEFGVPHMSGGLPGAKGGEPISFAMWDRIEELIRTSDTFKEEAFDQILDPDLSPVMTGDWRRTSSELNLSEFLPTIQVDGTGGHEVIAIMTGAPNFNKDNRSLGNDFDALEAEGGAGVALRFIGREGILLDRFKDGEWETTIEESSESFLGKVRENAQRRIKIVAGDLARQDKHILSLLRRRDISEESEDLRFIRQVKEDVKKGAGLPRPVKNRLIEIAEKVLYSTQEISDREELYGMFGIEDFNGGILYHEGTGKAILLVGKEGLGRAVISRLLVGTKNPDGKETIGSGWSLISQEVTQLFVIGKTVFGGTRPLRKINPNFRELIYRDKPSQDKEGKIIAGELIRTGVFPTERIVEISEIILLTDEKVATGLFKRTRDRVSRILTLQKEAHQVPTEVLEDALYEIPIQEFHVGVTQDVRDARLRRIAKEMQIDLGKRRFVSKGLAWFKVHLPHGREILRVGKELQRQRDIPIIEETKTKREKKVGPFEVRKVVTVKNPYGLHVRPVAAILSKINEFSDTEIRMRNHTKGIPRDLEGIVIKLPMDLLMLDVGKDDMVEVIAKGERAEEALKEIEREILRIYDRPVQDGGGKWSLDAEEAWQAFLKRTKETKSLEEGAFIKELYEEFVDKSYWFSESEKEAEKQAIRNDEMLKRMRESQDPKIRALYEKIEDYYIEQIKQYTGERIRPIAEKIDLWNLIPLDIYLEMGRLGIYSTQFPQTYGGMGLSTWAWERVNMVVSEASSGVTLGALNVLGSLYPYLFERATEEQKKKYLRPVLLGLALGNFGLTESEAGSDNSGMKTEWKEGLVNGEKRFITVGAGILPPDFREIVETKKPEVGSPLYEKYVRKFGEKGYDEFREEVIHNHSLYVPIPHYMIAAVRTQPKNEAKPRDGIGGIIITLKDAGFEPMSTGDSVILSRGRGVPTQEITAKSEPVMGQRGSGTTQFFLTDVPVSLEEHLIGDRVHGLNEFLKTLSESGRLTISGHGVGILWDMVHRLEGAVEGRMREGGNESPEVEGAKLFLKTLWAEAQLTSAMLERASRAKDRGESVRVSAAVTKIVTSESSRFYSGEAIPYFFALGDQIGRERAEMRYRDAKLLEIGEGTSEMQREIIKGVLLREPLLDGRATGYAKEKGDLTDTFLITSDPQAKLLLELIDFRNDLVGAYQRHQNQILYRDETEEEEKSAVFLRDIAFDALVNVEITLQKALTAYETGIIGLPEWVIETSQKQLLSSFSNLPHEERERLEGTLYGLLNLTSSRDGGNQQAKVRSMVFQDINGLVAIPTLYHLAKKGLFGARENEYGAFSVPDEWVGLKDIAVTFNPIDPLRNLGSLYGAMRALALAGWIQLRGVDETTEYRLTEPGRVAVFLAKKGFVDEEAVLAIEHFRDYHAYFRSPSKAPQHILEEYRRLIQKSVSGWSLPTSSDLVSWGIVGKEKAYIAERVLEQMRAYLTGMIRSPTMVALGFALYERQGRKTVRVAPSILEEFKEGSADLGELVRKGYHPDFLEEAFHFLTAQGIVEQEEKNNKLHLTPLGKEFVARFGSYGVPAAYLKSYQLLHEILWGDPDPLGILGDHHLDRLWDIVGSGYAHEAYLKSMEAIDAIIFNRPIDEQPLGISTMGAGDGRILVERVKRIIERDERGKHLKTHPLVVVGSDYNWESIDALKGTLEKELGNVEGIKIVVLRGDVTDPVQFGEEMRRLNLTVPFGKSMKSVTLGELYHTQEFIPHERHLKMFTDDLERDRGQAIEIIERQVAKADRPLLWEALRESGGEDIPEKDRFLSLPNEEVAGLVIKQLTTSGSNRGRLVPASVIFADLIQFFERWTPYSRHGLSLLELHTPRTSEMEEEVPKDLQVPMKVEQIAPVSYWGTHYLSAQWIIPFQDHKLAAVLARLELKEQEVWPKAKSGLPVSISLAIYQKKGVVREDLGQWPLEVEASWQHLLKRIEKRRFVDEEGFVRELYEEFVDKVRRLRQENPERLAVRNDTILKRMRESADADVRRVYQKMEDLYVAKVTDFFEKELKPISMNLDAWGEWPYGLVANPMKASQDPEVREIYQRIISLFTNEQGETVVDATSVVPLDLHKKMADQGLLGTQFPQRLDGLGLSENAWVRIVAESARQSSGFTVMEFNVNVGVYLETLKNQPDAIKEKWMVPILNGEALGAFLLTEPNAGSDNSNLESRLEKGKVYGNNIFITNGMILPANYREILTLYEEIRGKEKEELLPFKEYAEQIQKTLHLYTSMRHLGVKAARIGPRDENNSKKGISAVLLVLKEANRAPVRVGSQGKQLQLEETIRVQGDAAIGQKGSGTATFFFEGTPVEEAIGELDGFLKALMSGRGAVGAHALGISEDAEGLLEEAIKNAKGKDGIEEEMVIAAQTLLDELRARNRLMRLFIEETASAKDRGENVDVMAALSKLFASEMATRSAGQVYRMVHNLGAGPEIVEHLAMRYRDAKVTEIYEGTNEIQRIFIITPRLLKETTPSYHRLLDMPNLPKAISEVIMQRNQILDAYRKYLERPFSPLFLVIHETDEPPVVKLKQIAPFHLPDLEMHLLSLLLGYEASQKAEGEEKVFWESVISGLLQETPPLLSDAVRNLPPEEMYSADGGDKAGDDSETVPQWRRQTEEFRYAPLVGQSI